MQNDASPPDPNAPPSIRLTAPELTAAHLGCRIEGMGLDGQKIAGVLAGTHKVLYTDPQEWIVGLDAQGVFEIAAEALLTVGAEHELSEVWVSAEWLDAIHLGLRVYWRPWEEEACSGILERTRFAARRDRLFLEIDGQKKLFMNDDMLRIILPGEG